MRIGVDRDEAVPLEGDGQQFLGRILPFGPAIDLDRSAELGARCEDELRIEP